MPAAEKADRLIDTAIDDAVHGIMGAEPPAGLRQRVLRRLSEPERRRLVVTPRLAMAGLVLLVAAGAFVVRTVYPARQGSIPMVSAPGPVRPSEPSGTRVGTPPAEPAAAGSRTPVAARAPRAFRAPEERVVSATSVGDPDHGVDITPLEPLRTIEPAPMETETVRIDEIAVQPLQMEPVRIEPLSSMPR
jgi:hypothetical protein